MGIFYLRGVLGGVRIIRLMVQEKISMRSLLIKLLSVSVVAIAICVVSPGSGMAVNCSGLQT